MRTLSVIPLQKIRSRFEAALTLLFCTVLMAFGLVSSFI